MTYPAMWQQEPRKRQLSREAILEAAFKILDAEGIEAVTMRRIADALNTGPASLYAHVASKDELHALMLDQVGGEFEVPAPDPDRWQELTKDYIRGLVGAMTSHMDVARVAIAKIPVGPNAVRTTEGLLAILRAGGVSDQDAAWAVDILSLYAVAQAYEHGLYALAATRGDDHKEPAVIARIHAFFDSLPAEQFPNIKGLAQELTAGGGDARFEFGLDLLVRGLASRNGQ